MGGWAHLFGRCSARSLSAGRFILIGSVDSCSMPSSSRRFPSPWSSEFQPHYYVVRAANGQQLAYIYYSNEPDRRSAAKLLTKHEARGIVANIAKLPTMLRK